MKVLKKYFLLLVALLCSSVTYGQNFNVRNTNYNWIPAGKGTYNNKLLDMQMECAFEIAENYNGDGYYCRVYPFASHLENPEGCYIPFFIDEAGNAVSIPSGTYNMGVKVNDASFEFYYDPESSYGSYCQPFVNDGNVYYLYGVWKSGGSPAWVCQDAFMWTEGSPTETAISKFFDDEDALIELSNKENIYYDLSGRRVENPTRGIYIVNGRKFFVK